jgi:hypothetical protein
MDPSIAAIEVAAARWEQWVGATQRAERMRALAAVARPRRRAVAPARRRPRSRSSLLWMLAVSALGFWLLR